MKNYIVRLCALLTLWSGAGGLLLPAIWAAPLVITINTQVVNESCPGTADGSILSIPAGGSGTYFFTWSTGDQVAQITGLTAGTYTVTVTDTQGGVATASATVGVNSPAPIAVVGNDTFICGTSFLLNGATGPANTGQWLNLNSAGSILNPTASQTAVSGMMPGANTFIWVVTSGLCTNADTITVRVSNTTQIDAGQDTLLCGNQLDLRGSATGSGSGLWTNNGPALNIPNPSLPQATVSGFAAGVVYTLVWTVTEGPCTASDSIRVEALQAPTANFTFNGLGQSVTFTDLSNLAGTWAWDFGDGGNSSVQNPAYSYPIPGNYVVCLTVTNDCGSDTLCRELTLNPVAVDPSASVALTLSPVPATSEVQLTLSGWPDATVEISLLSLSGQRLLSMRQTTLAGGLQASLDLDGIAPGFYMVKVESEGKSEIRRLLVAR